MTVSSAASFNYEDSVHLALGAFGGGVCVWEFSTVEGLTSRCSDADAHTGPVRSCKFTSLGQLMTAGDDGLIQVINARKSIRIALLEAHEDQVNALSIVEEESGFVHLLSAANDASVAVWGRLSGRWECKRRMRRHRGPVLALATHPSGRLALSLGADGTMRTWNLVRGRLAFVVKLKSRPERAMDVLWSPDGTRYIIEFPHRFDCYSVESAHKASCSIAVPEGLSAITFVSSSILVFASGLRLSFRNIVMDGTEISSLSLSYDDGVRIKRSVRSLVWDQHERLLFILTRHSEGSGLMVYRLPVALISEAETQSADVTAVMLCRTQIPFRVTSFHACRFKVRSKISDDVQERKKAKPKLEQNANLSKTEKSSKKLIKSRKKLPKSSEDGKSVQMKKSTEIKKQKKRTAEADSCGRSAKTKRSN